MKKISERRTVYDHTAKLNKEEKERINRIEKRFGELHYVRKVNSQDEYANFLRSIENQALSLRGDGRGDGVKENYDTIDIAFNNAPLMLPDPRVCKNTELSLFKSKRDSVCSIKGQRIYVHKRTDVPIVSGLIGVGVSSTSIFNSFAIDFSAPIIPEYQAMKLKNKEFEGMTSINCEDNIFLSFRSVEMEEGCCWVLVNSHEASAYIEKEQAKKWKEVENKVNGRSPFTVHVSGQILTGKYIVSSNTATINSTDSWVNINNQNPNLIIRLDGLPVGFTFYLNNISGKLVTFTGANLVYNSDTIRGQGLFLVRKEGRNEALCFKLK